MAAPLIALLTDFGVDDVYVGVVKLVLAGRAAGVPVVDLAHGVPAGDVVAGALGLAGAARYLPDGAVVMAVVDPGVGSARRALAVQTERGFWVGPDNGLLELALRGEKIVRVAELPIPAQAASTFHGRDVFAPVAARLALGEPIDHVGIETDRALQTAWPEPIGHSSGFTGQVAHVDRFGNLITNLRHPGRAATLHIADQHIALRSPGARYAQVDPGALLALVTSFDLVEIAVRDGSAAKKLGAGRGAVVRMTC